MSVTDHQFGAWFNPINRPGPQFTDNAIFTFGFVKQIKWLAHNSLINTNWNYFLKFKLNLIKVNFIYLIKKIIILLLFKLLFFEFKLNLIKDKLILFTWSNKIRFKWNM